MSFNYSFQTLVGQEQADFHYRAEVRLSFITTTVWEESQVTPKGRHL